MSRTKHMQSRMDQRSITNGVVELVMAFGENVDDKVVLNKKSLQALVHELNRVKKLSLKALERGGAVVVEGHGCQITTYALDSYKREH